MRFKVTLTQNDSGLWEWVLSRTADEFAHLEWVTVKKGESSLHCPDDALEDAIVAQYEFLDK